jgi:hypothetical protein
MSLPLKIAEGYENENLRSNPPVFITIISVRKNKI